LQDRLLALKHTFSQRSVTRSYEAHLWEYPNEVQKAALLFVDSGDFAADNTVPAVIEGDSGRLYEDPDYLQQYVVYWNEGDVSGRTMTAEDEAYLSAENAAYLRKVSTSAVSFVTARE